MAPPPIQNSPFGQQVTFLSVADLDASSYFYGTVLQLPLALDQGPCRIYAVSRSAFLGVCTCTGPTQVDGVIITLVHTDLDHWYKRLLDFKVAIKSKPSFNSRFNITHLFAEDPDGYVIEIQTFHDPDWPAP